MMARVTRLTRAGAGRPSSRSCSGSLYEGSLRKCSATREPANAPRTMRIAVTPRGAVSLASRKTTSVKMMATAKPTMPPAIRPTHSTAEEA
jgi:hypothetical protein